MQVIRAVQHHGGDVIKFAGDAMIIAFYPRIEETAAVDEGYSAAVRRCAVCALEVRSANQGLH
jgi:class 3 adenylate cyclase